MVGRWGEGTRTKTIREKEITNVEKWVLLGVEAQQM
jgi:hypothetical protein